MDLFKIIAATLKDNPYDVDHNQLAGKVEDAIKVVMHRPASGSPSTTNRSSRWALVLRIKSQTDRINNQLKNEKALVERNEELEETTAKVEIANGEMCEAINRLIKERDNAAETAFNLKTRGTKQSARIQNLERSLENERAQGEKTTEMLDDLRRMNNSQAEALKKAWRGEDSQLQQRNAQLQLMNDSQAETIGKQWKDAEEASERHCAEHSKWKASSLNKIEQLEQDLKEAVGISDSYVIRIDDLERQALKSDTGMAMKSIDSLKRESTWKTAQIREKDHLIKELKGNVSFLDEERNLLLKQRTSLQAQLNNMTTAKDSLAGQLSEARGELITTNGGMSQADADDLRVRATSAFSRADQMTTKLNKIQGILRNP